jgi:hypothetical protein
MDRALRRHHAERLKRNRRFYYGHDLALDPVRLGRALATAAVCSCWMCGNPRKHFGDRGIQELRLLQDVGEA